MYGSSLFAVYTYIKLLHHIPETDAMLHVNNISIKKKRISAKAHRVLSKNSNHRSKTDFDLPIFPRQKVDMPLQC